MTDVQPRKPRTIDLSTSRNLHIIAIGGSGMSAIAGVLLDMGHRVTGSDANPSGYLDSVAEAGAQVWVGHDGDRLPADTEAVIVSTAISGYGRRHDDMGAIESSRNPEVVEALRRGIPVLRRAEILASMSAVRRCVAVAGTHGKTTTATLLAHALEAAGERPSWVIGGELLGPTSAARWGAGPWFVVEADESDGTFLQLGAEFGVVTNLEPDHLETYGGWEGLQEAFETFVSQASGGCVVCLDDPGAAALATSNAVTYGEAAASDYRIVDVEAGRFESSFGVRHDGQDVSVRLPAPGLHNVRNATGAMAMAHRLGVPLAAAAAGIGTYCGVGRRFQDRGGAGGVSFVDDYAHLPTEVRAVIAAARDGGWKRIVAVFQPHRYSRTEQVGADFAGAFDGADLVVLTDIYAAGEAPRPGIDGQIVRHAVESTAEHPPLTYVADRTMLAAEVNKLLRDGDLCLSVGAGDITRLADEIKAIRLQ